MHSWYLEGIFDSGNVLKQQRLSYFPQVLGRDARLDCTILGASISRRHAELLLKENALWIKDLGSRNGTCVNRVRIQGPTPLHHGDVIHLGDVEFRILDSQHFQKSALPTQGTEETSFISIDQLSEHFPYGITHLEQLIQHKQIRSVYQPIVRSGDLSVVGYELLTRGANEQLPESPLPLFDLAESFGLELELSELMRTQGILSALKSGLQGHLLVNTHPKELADIDRLLGTLYPIRKAFPKARLTLEIHEHAVTDDISVLKVLQTELKRMSINLAFDDFGVGQSRLLEMVEAKPDLIKFDRVLVADIDKADDSRLNLVKHLKDLATELQIQTLAECVSNKNEYLKCEELGFGFYQGFYLSRPKPIEKLVNTASVETR